MMKLDRTKELIQGTINADEPELALIHVLESAIELVQLPDNDFSWSYWKDAQQAAAEIEAMIAVIKTGSLPNRNAVAVIFAPTGPLQEVSLSSGWGKPFLMVAEKYDQVEKLLWPGR